MINLVIMYLMSSYYIMHDLPICVGLFYMAFHNKADFFLIKLSSSQHKMFYFKHCDNRQVPGRYAMHLRDDLKMQYSVDICVKLLSL